ncbi:hypothetical protein ACLIJR_17185 [Hydrogenophaga sp. XSHU_21]
MPTEFRLFSLLRGLCIACGAGLALGVQAQGFSAFISPPRFELQLEAGQTVRQVFEIQHVGQIRGQYRIYSADWKYLPDQSVVTSEPGEPLSADSCRPWVAIERRDLALDPGARYRYRFEVSAPAGTPPRECRFALMVEGRDATGGAVQAGGRIGVIVYAAIGGAAPVLEVVGTRVATVQGRQLPVVDVRNSGNAHGRLAGFVTGTDADGKRLEFGPADMPILPGETRSVALIALAEGNQPAPTVRFPVRIAGSLEWGRNRLPLDARFVP